MIMSDERLLVTASKDSINIPEVNAQGAKIFRAPNLSAMKLGRIRPKIEAPFIMGTM